MVRYIMDTAIAEATRCLMCHDAPCHKGCPASVNPKYFIRKIRFGDMAGAVRLLREANVLAGSCAYICPCLSTCGSECTHEKLTRPIDISGLQRFVMDWERESGMVIPPPPRNCSAGGQASPHRVAIVGAGPAGLACAADLAVAGLDVHIYEQGARAGGQLRLSIPSGRLPSDVVDFEIEFIEKLGVQFHFNQEINDLTELKKNHDALFFATGLMGSRSLGIPGSDKQNIFDALDFLMQAKEGNVPRLGKRVLVIGGGDTAIDAARTAAEQGAKTMILYRRTQMDMPAYRPDIQEAFDEGVEFWFRVIPQEVLGGESVEGIRLQRVSWKGSGRRAKEYDIEGPDFEIKADTIINAIGQVRASDFDLKISKEGWIACDPETMKTSDGVFVGGDFFSGGATAVAAIGDGKRAANAILDHLGCSGIGKRSGFYSGAPVDLSVDFCGVHFENPFILAAAPPSDELDMVREAFKAGWAGAVLKTTSVEGTPVDLKYPMMSGIDYESGKLSAMGNIDLISEYHIDVVEERVRKLKAEFPTKVVIASIMGSEKDEWQSLVRRLSDAGVDMIECSFSCPQGSLGAKPGQMLAQDTALTGTVAGWIKEAASAHPRNVPVVIKITPHVTDICEVAEAVKDAGCDAVCASNTIQSLMGIDLNDWIPYPKVEGKSSYSGMSGPAIKPQTLKVISQIAKDVGIPITGTGGPVTWEDAAEFILSGATTVQFCTAVMHYGFDIIDDLTSGLSDYLVKKKLKSVSELIGRSLPHIVSHEELSYQKKVVSKIDQNKCICDDLCHIACRDGGHMAISVGEDRKPIVDNEKCVGCGLCRLICPVSDCIQMGEIDE